MVLVDVVNVMDRKNKIILPKLFSLTTDSNVALLNKIIGEREFREQLLSGAR